MLIINNRKYELFGYQGHTGSPAKKKLPRWKTIQCLKSFPVEKYFPFPSGKCFPVVWVFLAVFQLVLFIQKVLARNGCLFLPVIDLTFARSSKLF
jgi:hypothetical protein